MVSREKVLEQALALPLADQAYLADVLEQRMAGGQFSSPEIGEVWSKEIDRRVAAFDRGETTALDFEKSLEHLRQATADHRSRKASQ